MALFYKVKRWLLKHFKDNFLVYFSLAIVFAIGIIIGAITIKILNIEQKSDIIVFLNSFFKSMNNNGLENLAVLKQSIVDNFKTIGLIWVTGLIMIGVIIIPIIVIFRGFALGFTVGFLVNEYGLKGFLFSILGILPQNLFIIPGLIAISTTGLVFSINSLKGKKSRFKNLPRNNKIASSVANYSIIILFFSIIIFIGTLIEAYISPVFLGALWDYFK